MYKNIHTVHFNINEGKDSHQVRLSQQGHDTALVFLKGHRINLSIKFGKLVQYCCQTEQYS